MRDFTVNRDTMVLKNPASWWRNLWREALVSGNGVLGGSFYGGSKHQTVMLTHTDLWHAGENQEVPDVHEALQRMRDKMDAGEFREASWEIVNELKKKGYQSKLESPLPVGDLKITIAPRGTFSHYQRALFMDSGEACSQWLSMGKLYETGGFVSRADDMILYRICSEDTLEVDLKLDMHKNAGEKLEDYVNHIEESKESRAFDSYLTYTAANVDGTDYGMAAKIVTDGEVEELFCDTLRVKNARQIVVAVKVFIRGEKDADIERLLKELADFDGDYEAAFKRHKALHEPLYRSAELILGGTDAITGLDAEEGAETVAMAELDIKAGVCTGAASSKSQTAYTGRCNEELLQQALWESSDAELVEKLWRFGRYLFISGTREDSNPFALYGLWAGSYRPMWSHNMANENLQMIYWHCFTGNLSTIHEAVFDYYNERIDEYRKNAGRLFGCRGIYMTAGTTPGVSSPTQVVPVIINWIGAGGWLAQHYVQYARYKKDEAYIKTEILPYLNGVAEFYEDFITFYPDGRIKLYPSVSPENTPQNFMPPENIQMAHPMPTTINSTIDLAIIKEFFTNMLVLSEEYGMYEDRRSLWEKILASIPPYKTNALGAIREWQEDIFEDRYDHRHLSHIYPVFPGYEVNSVDNKEELEAYKKAVSLRKIDAQTGWSMAHMAAIYDRFDDGEKAMECLDNMAKSCLLPNFFTLHNDWRGMGITLDMDPSPVQLDAIMGYVNAVQEMIFYTSENLLKLLPALPEKLKKGSVKRFQYANGSLDMSWDMEKNEFEAVFEAKAPHTIRVKLPERFADCEISCEGAAIVREKEGMLQVRYEEGGKIVIRKYRD